MATSVAQKKGKSQETETSRSSWSGLPSLNRLRHEFDDLWNRFMTEMPVLWGAERTDLRWAFEVDDQPEAYVIKAEAPGFAVEDFDIELRGEQLILRAKRSEEKKEEKEETFTATEFYRSMAIPPYVDVDRIQASYKNGVLELTLPKTEEGKGRKIPVSRD